MKNPSVLLTLALLVLAGCPDQHDNAQVAQSQQMPQQAKAPISMRATDARIAGLAARSVDCNIESANDEGFEPNTPTLSMNEPIRISGWLIDVASKTVPANAVLRVETESGDKAWEQKVSEWGNRGDVVATHGNVKAYLDSGFQVTIELGWLAPGAYNVYMAYRVAGQESACGVGRRFNLK